MATSLSAHNSAHYFLVTNHCLHPPMNFPPGLLDLGAAKDGPILRIECSGDPATTHGHALVRVLRRRFGKGARWDCSVLHDRGTCPYSSRHRTHAFCPARPRDRPRTRCLLRCSADGFSTTPYRVPSPGSLVWINSEPSDSSSVAANEDESVYRPVPPDTRRK